MITAAETPSKETTDCEGEYMICVVEVLKPCKLYASSRSRIKTRQVAPLAADVTTLMFAVVCFWPNPKM
jgi:hypothetical protein